MIPTHFNRKNAVFTVIYKFVLVTKCQVKNFVYEKVCRPPNTGYIYDDDDDHHHLVNNFL